MPFLSRASFQKLECRIEALEAENAKLEEKSRRIAQRFHALERLHQTLVLRVGLMGYHVEPVAEVPAKPATLKLTKAREK
jgi:predicted nuclease with TOPRIM domain